MGSAIHKQYSVTGWSESIHTARWMELCCGLCNTQTILSYWLERVNTHSQVDGAVLWALQYTNNTQLLVGASQYTQPGGWSCVVGSAIHKQYSVTGWSESIHTARWMELCCGLCNTQTILSYWLERVNTHSQVDGAVLWALQYTNNTQLLVGASQYTQPGGWSCVVGSAIHKQYSVTGWSESIHTARWMELCCGLCNTQTILSYWLERVNTHSQVDGAVLWALQYTNNTQLLVGASQYTVHKQYSVTGWSESIHSTQTILSYWLERVNTQYTNNTQLVVGVSQYTVHKQYSVIGWSESIHSTQTILSYWLE